MTLELNRRFSRIVLGGTLAATLLFTAAACGDGDEEADTGPTVPTGGTAPATNTAAATNTTAASPSAAASASASASAAASTTATAATTIKVGSTSKGNALLDGQDRTLYIWDTDTTPGQSACSGGCATNWPPVTTTATAAPTGIAGATGEFTVITRADGTRQIAYKGKPLYRFAGDTAAGQVNGDGVGGTWHIAVP